ncbi:unnamed protein product [Bursaphelenchus okinawaensis]|uniref:C2H2-type domain-containing protein n=1 Tax=Bursaphelenchus okinawaensis TaxID=465554 RepID=A0A811KA16_9BILA|nr:unnamed protein product [Bursaphelenchus okinawaensis]CAG9096738.1 unnamed protein product [Bursaphelenchus okinawaensis]
MTVDKSDFARLFSDFVPESAKENDNFSDIRYDDYKIKEADFFPEYKLEHGFGTKCFDHPNLPFRRLERHVRREISLFGTTAALSGNKTPYRVNSGTMSPQGMTPIHDNHMDTTDNMAFQTINPEYCELRNKLNDELKACDELLCKQTENDSWKKFFRVIDDCDTIQEIYVEAKESRPLIKDGPRQRYQRFREKAFVCDVCDHWFTLKQNVQMHIFNYHMGPNVVKPRRGKRYKCTKCDQMFKSMIQAQKHERRMHKEKIRQMFFRCEQCSKVYQTASQLREHVSIMHLNERPFKCEQCDAAFGRRGGLRRHIVMVHTGHTYKCPVEGCEHPGYKCSKALAAHIRSVHTKDRPFVCLMCEKSFVRKNDLKMHEFTHGSASTFECELCGETFKRAVYRKKHQVHCLQRVEKAKQLGIDPKELRKFEMSKKKKTEDSPSTSKQAQNEADQPQTEDEPSTSKEAQAPEPKRKKKHKKKEPKIGSKLEESVKKIKKMKREQKKRERAEKKEKNA